ncbi:unnamed protein product [Brassica napus]|uniref:(rape) hypothetical protein n=1 Tax=Brassica napus TaxID=3708 RepID=A0A816JY95_BRANA|nr:unnamed protein product [Brassica napus]
MHLLSTQRLNAMEPLRMKKVEELMSFINKCCEREEAVDIARAFFVTALNIISNALFSTDFATHDSKSSHEYHNTVISLMNVTGKPNVGDYFPFLRFLDLQGTRKEATLCTQRLFKVFQDFMNARMAKKSSHTKDISSFDMLDTLLDLTQENKAELSLNDIKHFLQDLFTAGTDTNSSTMEWVMSELIRNPEKMVKAQSEIRQVIGENGVVQESDIPRLPYLQAIVKETLRLHPAAPLIPRKSESDVHIFGFLIPKNASVYHIISRENTPQAAREVLRTHDQVLSNRGSNNSINSINHQELSLVWAPSSSLRWRLLRKLSATMLFSPQRMEATKALRMNKVKDLISFMSESSEREKAVDISHALFTTTLNIISNILFSVDLGSYDPFKKLNGFQDTVIGVMEAIGNPDAANYFPFLRFLDLQGNSKKMKDNIERLFRVFRGFIDAKIAEKALLNNPKDVTDGDFVDALLHLTEGDEAELNTNDIEHFLSDLFTAGTDTSSSTVQWAMAELLSNPKTMKKARAEMDHVIGQNGIVQESDISEFPYLQAVVKERLENITTPPPLLHLEAGEAHGHRRRALNSVCVITYSLFFFVVFNICTRIVVVSHAAAPLDPLVITFSPPIRDTTASHVPLLATTPLRASSPSLVMPSVSAFIVLAALPFMLVSAGSSNGSNGLVSSTAMKTTGGPGVSSSEGHCCSSVLRNLHNDGSSVWNIISESWISRLKDPRGVQLHPSTSISLPLPFISANEKSTAVLFSHRQGGAVTTTPLSSLLMCFLTLIFKPLTPSSEQVTLRR